MWEGIETAPGKEGGGGEGYWRGDPGGGGDGREAGGRHWE